MMAWAQQMFVCEANGMKNIVTKSQGAHCRPYVKGMFGQGKAEVVATPPVPVQTAPTAPAVKNSKKALPETQPAVQAQPVRTKTLEEEVLEEVLKNNFPEQKPVLPPSESALMWECKNSDGSVLIMQSTDQPLDHCTVSDRILKEVKEYKGKQGRAELFDELNQKQTIQSQDIYKCFDAQGRPSYVAESQKDQFRQCTFWSRSFAGVKEALKQGTPSASAPAVQTIGTGEIVVATAQPKRLHCSGAGEVVFNGQTKQYQCASYSYDYTAGTTGGEIRTETRAVQIAEHRLDYFDQSGNCGGKVTSENGRVFHLEPTKDCPATIQIEARKVVKQVQQALNIPVNGAFKERQRNLSAQINQIAQEVGVDVYLVHAVISAESAYKPRAKSHAGAMGLMQLMPGTARRFGVTDAYNTGQNIRGGTTYLKYLLKFFNGNMQLAIAAYNAGEGNVKKYGYKIPPFIETRAYVPKVLEYYRRYRNNPSEIGL